MCCIVFYSPLLTKFHGSSFLFIARSRLFPNIFKLLVSIATVIFNASAVKIATTQALAYARIDNNCNTAYARIDSNTQTGYAMMDSNTQTAFARMDSNA